MIVISLLLNKSLKRKISSLQLIKSQVHYQINSQIAGLNNYSYKKTLDKIQRPMERRLLNAIKMGSNLSIKNKINKLSKQKMRMVIKMKKKISNIVLMNVAAARAATSYNSIKQPLYKNAVFQHPYNFLISCQVYVLVHLMVGFMLDCQLSNLYFSNDFEN